MFALTRKRNEALQDVLNGIGQVFFASVLVDPIVSQVTNWQYVLAGLFLSLVCWSFSVLYLSR